MSTHDASAAAKARNRRSGRFAEEARAESSTALGDTSAIGEPNPYSGARVFGDAQVDEIVHYYDMANQHRNPQRVVAIHPTAWATEYQLEDVVTGEQTSSDMRQYGWTRVESSSDE